MNLRKALFQHKTDSGDKIMKLLDKNLCKPRFQKLLFDKFYFAYLWRVSK